MCSSLLFRKRSARLKRFFDFYRDITASYVPTILPGIKPALLNRGDALDIIRLLRANTDTKRSQLTDMYFARRGTTPPPLADQHRAFNLVVQVMTMVKCSAENQPSGVLELGSQPLPWRSDKSLFQFFLEAFGELDIAHINADHRPIKIGAVKSALTARRLSKVAGLSFRESDDLRSHLRMDINKGIVEIYHFTSVLKEHLLASRPIIMQDRCIQLRYSILTENVLRQISLEVIDSVQNILFPFDSDSKQLLRELVSKESFDPDCLQDDSTGYPMGEEISSKIFDRRLADLFEELENPTPRGFLEKWFQRKSGARYMMMATLISVLIAIGIGVLGLAVGIFQAWVSYQAWKHPVSPGA